MTVNKNTSQVSHSSSAPAAGITKALRTVMLLPMLVVFLIPLAQATSIGTVIMSRGVTVAVSEDGTERELSRRSDVMLGDQLSTGDDSRLQVRMVDDALLDLRSNTDIVLEVYQEEIGEEESQVLMELVGGTLSTLTGRFGEDSEDAYQLRSANASIGIRGTGFAALFEPGSNTTYTSVNSGGINLGSEGGSLPLGDDQAFRHGQVQDNQPPQGLLTPPPQLQQALLDEELVREEDEDDETEEGTEDQNGTTEDNGNGTAPAPSTEPDEDSLAGRDRLADLIDDSVDEDAVEASPDARLPLSIVEAAESSEFFLTAASGTTSSRFGLFANDEDDGVYALLYPEYPDLSEGYEEAFQVIRFSADPLDEFVLCRDLEILCGPGGEERGWFWGYWDSGIKVATRDDYEELDQLFIMQVPADTSITGFDNDILFYADIGGASMAGTDQSGTPLSSGSFFLSLSSTGAINFVDLNLTTDDDISWLLQSETSDAVLSSGTLSVTDLDGTVDVNGEEFSAFGDVSGVFQLDSDELHYFLGTFATTSDSPDDLSTSGVIIAPESE